LVKIKLILITIIICGVFLLAGCGDNGNGSSQPSGVSIRRRIYKGQKIKKEKTNAEKFLEYAIKAADLRNFNENG